MKIENAGERREMMSSILEETDNEVATEPAQKNQQVAGPQGLELRRW